jgi:hypothetical protein
VGKRNNDFNRYALIMARIRISKLEKAGRISDKDPDSAYWAVDHERRILDDMDSDGEFEWKWWDDLPWQRPVP